MKIIKLTWRLNIGILWKIKTPLRNGENLSFPKSFKASIKGCNKPKNLSFTGPNRIWNLPIILRSNKVKKATVSKISNKWRNINKKKIKILNSF